MWFALWQPSRPPAVVIRSCFGGKYEMNTFLLLHSWNWGNSIQDCKYKRRNPSYYFWSNILSEMCKSSEQNESSDSSASERSIFSKEKKWLIRTFGLRRIIKRGWPLSLRGQLSVSCVLHPLLVAAHGWGWVLTWEEVAQRGVPVVRKTKREECVNSICR